MLDFEPRRRSSTVRGREGPIATAVGEGRLMLLELLCTPESALEPGERVYIGREGRTGVVSVLGKMDYSDVSAAARGELPGVVERIVAASEARFVDYLNNAQALTPRVHALELIPGIGKIYTKAMLDERERSPFASFEDIQERVGLGDLAGHISQRIVDEIAGEARMNLFVRR